MEKRFTIAGEEEGSRQKPHEEAKDRSEHRIFPSSATKYRRVTRKSTTLLIDHKKKKEGENKKNASHTLEECYRRRLGEMSREKRANRGYHSRDPRSGQEGPALKKFNKEE